MRIVNLIEDSPGSRGCEFEHGLSFYIETRNHRLICDTGASGAFIKNAESLGIDLSSVDTVVISHGHYDHTGGLLEFAKINPRAKIYIHERALGEFYSLKNPEPKYIGMAPEIAELENAVFVRGNCRIDGELSLFSDVRGRRLWPKGNAVLKIRQNGRFCQDGFDHEQYLVINEGEKRVLISGCAHNGILNILDGYRRIFGGEPTHVISGFHTVKQEYTAADDGLIAEIAEELRAFDTAFYSGHCTGEHAMEIMQGIMGLQLGRIHSGDEVL